MRKKVMEEVSRQFCDICGKQTNMADVNGKDYCEEHWPEKVKEAKNKETERLLGATITSLVFADDCWSTSKFRGIRVVLKDGTNAIIEDYYAGPGWGGGPTHDIGARAVAPGGI